MPSEPEALFEEPLLASREELLNFQYKYTCDETESGGSGMDYADSDGCVSQTVAASSVAALWDVPDQAKPPAPARYVNDQSAPVGDDRNAPQVATPWSYAGDAQPPGPPAAAPASPDVQNADAASLLDEVGEDCNVWVPHEASSTARVEGIEFSCPAQVVLIGYGIGREVPGPPLGLDGGQPDMPEESRFVLMGGPTVIAAFDRSLSESSRRPAACSNHSAGLVSMGRATVLMAGVNTTALYQNIALRL